MDNRIRQIAIHDVSLNPVEAEVWITLMPERITPTTELRGRLMGPHCLYANTVEVAYPLRPLPPGRNPPRSDSLTMRVAIPEASLWEPESPFLYRCLLELWQDGRRCEQITLHHGLRSIQLSERGLRVNGRPLKLQGRAVSTCTEDEARTLRQSGCNLLLAPVAADTSPQWDIADRFGFFILGQVSDGEEQTLRQLPLLAQHASCLGWLIEEGNHPPSESLPPDCLLGLSWHSADRSPPPGLAHFLFGPADLTRLGMPLLVRGSAPNLSADAPVIGWAQAEPPLSEPEA